MTKYIAYSVQGYQGRIMTLAEQLADLKVHVEVTCPTHHTKGKSHTLTNHCGANALIQWVTIYGSTTVRTPDKKIVSYHDIGLAQEKN
tara:strand:+ start:226 stop:489 length:264 start_codon:yes stop_codon:yes gene_type:complete